MDISETIVFYDLKLATDDKWQGVSADVKTCPLGLYVTRPGAIYMY